ncbi:MAG TPA: hypothetical protein VK826_01975 [Bacteroidia bacterium]|nr:hypothetical protein [Bacteroidia bacterium]
MKPVVSLEDLNTEERKQLTALTMAGIKKGLLVYIVPFVVLTSVAIYINVHWVEWKLNRDGLREVINVIVVIGAILPARLFVNKVIQHTKASNAWKKKVIRGKIHGMDGKTLFISNQKINVPADVAAQFKVEDEVEIGISTVNDILIYAIKR